MKTFNIALLPGDGIGPDVVAETVKVLEAAAANWQSVELVFTTHQAGAAEYQRHGDD